MERFACRTEVISGEGALSDLGRLECRRLLVVTEQDKMQERRIRQVSDGVGRPEVRCFDNVDPEPTVYQAVEGSKVIKTFSPDLVAAVGG